MKKTTHKLITANLAEQIRCERTGSPPASVDGLRTGLDDTGYAYTPKDLRFAQNELGRLRKLSESVLVPLSRGEDS